MGVEGNRKPLRERGWKCRLNGYHILVAQLTKTQDVCDVCGNQRRKVKTYRVGQDGDLVRVDLCSEHAEPLEKMLKLGARLPSTAKRAKLWSFEEIERERRKQAKKENRPRS